MDMVKTIESITELLIGKKSAPAKKVYFSFIIVPTNS
jgi:hypothetical protein